MIYVYIYIYLFLFKFFCQTCCRDSLPPKNRPSTPRPRGSAALRDAIRQQLAAFDLTWLPRVGETVGSGGWFLFGFSPGDAAVGWFASKTVFFLGGVSLGWYFWTVKLSENMVETHVFLGGGVVRSIFLWCLCCERQRKLNCFDKHVLLKWVFQTSN